MKNRINTSQFHVKTRFLGNGRRNLISTSVNTKTESHKYGNGRTKIENGTGRNGNISVRFNPKHYKKRSTATLTLSELASKKFQQSTDTERASPAQHQTANHKTADNGTQLSARHLIKKLSTY